jgi:hypothetical protein
MWSNFFKLFEFFNRFRQLYQINPFSPVSVSHMAGKMNRFATKNRKI